MSPTASPNQCHHRLAGILTLSFGVVILYFALAPGGTGPSIPGRDKIMHAVGFAVLAAPMVVFWPRSLFWSAPAIVVYGAAIEVIQPYFGREAEVADLVADAVGVAAAVFTGWLVRWFRRPFPAPSDRA